MFGPDKDFAGIAAIGRFLRRNRVAVSIATVGTGSVIVVSAGSSLLGLPRRPCGRRDQVRRLERSAAAQRRNGDVPVSGKPAISGARRVATASRSVARKRDDSTSSRTFLDGIPESPLPR